MLNSFSFCSAVFPLALGLVRFLLLPCLVFSHIGLGGLFGRVVAVSVAVPVGLGLVPGLGCGLTAVC